MVIESLSFSQGKILFIHFFPKTIDMGKSVFIHRFSVPAAAVSDHPLPVVIYCQHGFDKHLSCSVKGNDDQHPFSLAKGTSA